MNALEILELMKNKEYDRALSEIEKISPHVANHLLDVAPKLEVYEFDFLHENMTPEQFKRFRYLMSWDRVLKYEEATDIQYDFTPEEKKQLCID